MALMALLHHVVSRGSGFFAAQAETSGAMDLEVLAECPDNMSESTIELHWTQLPKDAVRSDGRHVGKAQLS